MQKPFLSKDSLLFSPYLGEGIRVFIYLKTRHNQFKAKDKDLARLEPN